VWATEHSIVTTASPEQVWRVWADVPNWPEWNGDIESVELHGAFEPGSTIVMKTGAEEPIELRITDAVEAERFVDEADLGDVVVRTTHQVRRQEERGSRITYRMEITGSAADTLGPQIGPEISSDFPEVLSALARRAEAGAADVASGVRRS
jgi:uncharacterized membrane protein